MTSGVTGIPWWRSGGTSLICCLLMNRVQNRKDRRDSAGRDASSMGPSASSGDHGLEPAFLVWQRQFFVR
jgi:hypothetical protein